jgi:hypothetical protein
MKFGKNCFERTILYILFFVILAIYTHDSHAIEPDSINCSVRSSSKAKAFKKGKTSCEIVDHICALANGGLDNKANMQCQTTYASRTKDLIENTPEGRDLYCNEKNSLTYRTVFNSRERLNKVTYCKKK